MLKATKAVALAAGVMGVLAAGAVSADESLRKYHQVGNIEIMKPGRGVSLDIGGKHAVGYFIAKNNACHLTVVVADAASWETGLDSPGTRFTIPVAPGKGFQVDASAGQSAEFFCGPGAARMTARIYNRTPYSS